MADSVKASSRFYFFFIVACIFLVVVVSRLWHVYWWCASNGLRSRIRLYSIDDSMLLLTMTKRQRRIKCWLEWRRILLEKLLFRYVFVYKIFSYSILISPTHRSSAVSLVFLRSPHCAHKRRRKNHSSISSARYERTWEHMQGDENNKRKMESIYQAVNAGFLFLNTNFITFELFPFSHEPFWRYAALIIIFSPPPLFHETWSHRMKLSLETFRNFFFVCASLVSHIFYTQIMFAILWIVCTLVILLLYHASQQLQSWPWPE